MPSSGLLRSIPMLLLVSVLLMAGAVWAAPSANTYYVAPTGDDANPGTLAQPWRTIQHAANQLTPSDTVYIRAGTYHEHVRVRRSGRADAWLTLVAYPGEAPTVDGEGFDLWNWGAVIDLSEQSYMRVSGLRVINSAYAGIFADTGSHFIVDHCITYNTASSGIAFFGAQDVLVDGNEVIWAGWGGQQEHISIADVNGFEVRGNRVHGFNPATGGKEGIDAKDGAANGSIHHNQVYDLNRVGIYVDAFSRRTYNIEVYANLVHHIAADGMALASEAGGALENIRVYNNVSAHNRYVGLGISDCCADLSATHPMTDILILNNTFFGNGQPDWGGGIHIVNPDLTNLVIRNNVASQNLTFQILAEAGAPRAAMRIDHNLIDGYRGEPGELYGEDYTEGDPLFADPAAVDFHLRRGSPAIDRGAAPAAPAQDLDGRPRPLDGDADGNAAFDIGAYEIAPPGGQTYLPLIRR